MAFVLIASEEFTRRREDGTNVLIKIELFEESGTPGSESLGTVGEIVWEQGRDTDDIHTPIVPAQIEIELRKPASTLLKRLRAIDYHQFKLRVEVEGKLLIEGPVLEDLSNYELFVLTNTIRIVASDGLSDTQNEAGETDTDITTSIAAFLQQLKTKSLSAFPVDVMTEWQHDGRLTSDFFADFVRVDRPDLLSLQGGSRDWLSHLKAVAAHFGWRIAQVDSRWMVHEPFSLSRSPDAIPIYIDDGAGTYTLGSENGTKITLDDSNTIRFPSGIQSPTIGRFVQEQLLAELNGRRNLWDVWNFTFASGSTGWAGQNAVFSGGEAKLTVKDDSFIRQNGLTEGSAEFINAWGLAVEGDEFRIESGSNATRGKMLVTPLSSIDAVVTVLHLKLVSLTGDDTLYHDFEAGEWKTSQRGLDVTFDGGTSGGEMPWKAADLSKEFTTEPVPKGFFGYFEVEGRFDIVSGDSPDINEMVFEWLQGLTTIGNSPTVFRKNISERTGHSRADVQQSVFGDRNPFGTNHFTFLPTGGGTAQSSLWNDSFGDGEFGEVAARRKGKITNGTRQKYFMRVRDRLGVSMITPISFVDEDAVAHLCLPVKIRREIISGNVDVIMKETDLRAATSDQAIYDTGSTDESAPQAGSVSGGGGGGGGADPSTFLQREENLADLFDVPTALVNIGLSPADDVVFASLDTGQGANELFAMDQPVRSTDPVVFASVDTGQGANELYPMNQGVRTTDNVRFNDMEVTGTVNFVNEDNLQVEDKTITVNKNGTDVSAEGAGIIVERPAGNRSLLWAGGFWDVGVSGIKSGGATIVDSGEVLDVALSGNVPLKDAANVFSAMNIFQDVTVGNIIYTQATNTLSANTLDGADSSRFVIHGGGGTSTTRGAVLQVIGNQFQGGFGGSIIADIGQEGDGQAFEVRAGGIKKTIINSVGLGLGSSTDRLTANQFHPVSSADGMTWTLNAIERMKLHSGGGLSIATSTLTPGNIVTVNGNMDLTFAMDAGSGYKVGGTTVIDSNRDAFFRNLDVTGLATIATAEIGTLRTTLFKPNSVSGMGGEFIFNGTTRVVSIDTTGDTITVEDPVFTNDDSIIVSSQVGESGFSKTRLNITSNGTLVSGNTQYSYNVDASSPGADTDIESGYTAIKVDGNLIHINANEGVSNSPGITGLQSVSNFDLFDGSPTPVWELNPTGGVIGGIKFDPTHLWTEDGSQTAGTFSGLIQRQDATTKVFFGGADNNDGLNANAYLRADGFLFSPSIGDSLITVPENVATFGRNPSDATLPLLDNEWSAFVSRSTEGTTPKTVIARHLRIRKKGGTTKLKVTFWAKRTDTNTIQGASVSTTHSISIKGSLNDAVVFIAPTSYTRHTIEAEFFTADLFNDGAEKFVTIEIFSEVQIFGTPTSGTATVETFLNYDLMTIEQTT